MRYILPVSRIANLMQPSTVTTETAQRLWQATCVLQRETSERKAIGVAAPQLAIRERMFWIAERVNKVYINPFFTSETPLTPVPEGCLSVKGTKLLYVPRHSTITASYTTLVCHKNNDIEIVQVTNEVLDGVVAQAFQHELDHLNGVSILDVAVNLSREERRLYKSRN